MKALTLVLFFVLIFTGCNPNPNISVKKKCTKLGYKYAPESLVNKLTGKIDFNIICLSNIN